MNTSQISDYVESNNQCTADQFEGIIKTIIDVLSNPSGVMVDTAVQYSVITQTEMIW